jgi:hypothetical protein
MKMQIGVKIETNAIATNSRARKVIVFGSFESLGAMPTPSKGYFGASGPVIHTIINR